MAREPTLIEQWKKPPSRAEVISVLVALPAAVLLVIRIVTGS